MNQQYRPSSFSILPPVVKNLLIINGLFFLATIVLGNRFGIDLTRILGLHYITSEYFEPYQFVSYMFMHDPTGFAHIFFNMFAVWMFGSAIENVWGSQRFLVFYLITALGAAFIQLLYTYYQFHKIDIAIESYAISPGLDAFLYIVKDYFPYFENNQVIQNFVAAWSSTPASPVYQEQSFQLLNELIEAKKNIPTVGASGALFGLLLAFGMMFPNSVIYLYFAIPIKAKYFVILYGALELWLGVANNPADNVAHFAHLGGMLFGFILIKFWGKRSYN